MKSFNKEVHLLKDRIVELTLKRIKMRPDGPGKMGLTDPCPWAKKRQAHLL